nr:MAG: capsid protein [Picobirnavirus sp.]
MKEFAFLRATVSNKLPYDAPELIMDQVAIANAISYCNFLARVYMVAFLNNNDNRYTPRTLMSCMGVDYDSIMASLANFRYGINLLIQRISSLAVPKDVTYFAREAMIYANIYQDGTSIKDQMYLYVPESFFRYSDNADGEGTPGLTLDIFNDLSAGPEKLQLKTANQLIAYGNKLISGLFNSEAIATIAANITRAYGDSGIITMNYLEEGARIVPIFDIVVLEQMKNADVLPPTLCFSGEDGDVADQLSKSWTLTQAVLDNNDPAWWLKFNPVAGLTVADDNLRKSPYVEYFYMADSKKLITTTTGYTDAGVTIENTRLKTSILCDTQPTVADPNWDIKKQGNIRITVDGAAEVVVACTMIRMKDDENILSLDGNDFCDWYNLTTVHAYNQLASADFVNAMQFEAIRRSFTFAPNVVNIFTPFLQTESNLRSGVHAVQWDYDMDNYAIITNEELIRLHETCMYSMMDVPGVAKPYYGG